MHQDQKKAQKEIDKKSTKSSLTWLDCLQDAYKPGSGLNILHCGGIVCWERIELNRSPLSLKEFGGRAEKGELLLLLILFISECL